jgi:hypothetical protein
MLLMPCCLIPEYHYLIRQKCGGCGKYVWIYVATNAGVPFAEVVSFK